ncbi:MAG: Holliday junction resolvase RuvX [Alcanivorax sp.]
MIDKLENIINQRPIGRHLMGLDVGTKMIGIALCEGTHHVATPHMTIQRKKFSKDIKAVEKVIREFDVGGYVVGYPINMDGSEGRKCQSVRDFAMEFERQLSPDLIVGDSPWIALWDERLSTATVENFVDEAVDMSKRRAKEKGIIDKLAAQFILQGALDYIQDHKS